MYLYWIQQQQQLQQQQQQQQTQQQLHQNNNIINSTITSQVRFEGTWLCWLNKSIWHELRGKTCSWENIGSWEKSRSWGLFKKKSLELSFEDVDANNPYYCYALCQMFSNFEDSGSLS